MTVTSARFAVAYALAMYAARILPVGDAGLSYVWPACGVAALWFVALRTGRDRLVGAGVLVAITVTVNLLSGSTAWIAGWFGGVNLAQALVAGWALRRLCPDLWGAGGTGTFDRLHTVFSAAVVALGSSTLAAALATPGLAAAGESVTIHSVLMHVSRNTFGFLLVVLTGHLVAHGLRRRHRAGLALWTPARPSAELVALVAVSGTVYWLTFFVVRAPVSFLPLVVTIWAGLRFSPATVALQATGGAVLTMTATVQGIGPFSMTREPTDRILLAQVLLTLILLSGLALAANRRQIESLLDAVQAERHAAERAAGVMGTTFGALQAGLLVLSPHGTIELANDPAQGMMRLRLVGGDVVEGADWSGLWAEVVADRQLRGFDVYAQSGNDRRVLRGHVVPLSGEEGALVHLVDVTDAEADRDELLDFAARAAHDLRGPLTVFRGWLEMLELALQVGTFETDAPPALARLYGVNARMTTMIEGLLDNAVRRAEHRALGEVDLSDALIGVIEQLGAQDTVRYRDLPVVRGDETMLTRVLLNLVGNAIKHIPHGREPAITVTCEPGLGGDIEVRITDNGDGIPVHQRQLVFEPYFRGATSAPGSGMGLAMCRQVISQHGGSLHVEEADDGVGCCFVMVLPADGSAQEAAVTTTPLVAQWDYSGRPRPIRVP